MEDARGESALLPETATAVAEPGYRMVSGSAPTPIIKQVRRPCVRAAPAAAATAADPTARRKRKGKPAPEPVDAEPVDWSDEDILKVHDGLLVSTLVSIRKHPRSKLAQEGMRWICGRDYPIKPFSFRACCLLAGLDHEELRAEIILIYRALLARKRPSRHRVIDRALDAIKANDRLHRRQKLQETCASASAAGEHDE